MAITKTEVKDLNAQTEIAQTKELTKDDVTFDLKSLNYICLFCYYIIIFCVNK